VSGIPDDQPPTVHGALRAGRARLAGPGSGVRGETPALDAEVLLRHVLGLERGALYTHPERRLTPAEGAAYRALLERRRAGEPVAYLIGGREFMGLRFAVDRRVLVPRPETELLVERALALLEDGPRPTARRPGARRPDGRPPETGRRRTVVDVGTGSGAVAVSVAALVPRPEGVCVVGTDVSWDALQVARLNAQRLVPPDRPAVSFVQCSLLTALRGPLDLVLANLPYVPAGELSALPLPVRAFEPPGALGGGADGLDLYRALLAELPGTLAPRGAVLLECDPRQAEALGDLVAQALPDGRTAIRPDLAGRPRLVELIR
jgi:release factor glutamine methyltransferase